MTLELLRELMQHMEWADALVWSAIVREPRASEEPSLVNRLFHIHTTQRAFLLVWKEQALDSLPRRKSFTEPHQLRDWARQYYPQATTFVDELDAQQLSKSTVMPWADSLVEKVTGGPAVGVPTLAETILQLTAHSTYHRGQINAQLRQAGIEPPLTDFIAWIWLGRPEPEWPPSSATLRPA